MSGDLVAFLAARLDEDAATAKAAWPGPWDLETETGGFGPVAYVLMPLPPHKGARTGLTRYIPLGTQDADTALHIARHDPARVLREVACRHRTLNRHRNCGSGVGFCDDGGHGIDGVGCNELLDAAAIYSDHEGYRDEWRP